MDSRMIDGIVFHLISEVAVGNGKTNLRGRNAVQPNCPAQKGRRYLVDEHSKTNLLSV